MFIRPAKTLRHASGCDISPAASQTRKLPTAGLHHLGRSFVPGIQAESLAAAELQLLLLLLLHAFLLKQRSATSPGAGACGCCCCPGPGDDGWEWRCASGKISSALAQALQFQATANLRYYGAYGLGAQTAAARRHTANLLVILFCFSSKVFLRSLKITVYPC